jgi:hypothetical protein
MMRAHKLREEVAKKKKDEHSNTIQPMIPTKQEWRVKEKTSMPTLTTSNDDMDLLDDDESPLMKDESPSPLEWMSTWYLHCWPSSEVSRRRLLSHALVPRKSCSRSPRSQAST